MFHDVFFYNDQCGINFSEFFRILMVVDVAIVCLECIMSNFSPASVLMSRILLWPSNTGILSKECISKISVIGQKRFYSTESSFHPKGVKFFGLLQGV